jgi:hypothetical protein
LKEESMKKFEWPKEIHDLPGSYFKPGTVIIGEIQTGYFDWVLDNLNRLLKEKTI